MSLDSESKVQCYICKKEFRATNSHINLICKECQKKEKGEFQMREDEKERFNKLMRQIREIFDRFNFRVDIERELQSLGFEELFGDPDEKIYFTPNKPHEILVYVNWIDGCFWIYKRIEKI